VTTTTTTDARTPDKGTRPAINPWYDLLLEIRQHQATTTQDKGEQK
jgi:hypothetical protein